MTKTGMHNWNWFSASAVLESSSLFGKDDKRSKTFVCARSTHYISRYNHSCQDAGPSVPRHFVPDVLSLAKVPKISQNVFLRFKIKDGWFRTSEMTNE